ncbi:SbcC/MukB-like Walker B domain-containing protein [Labilibacter marinus]|uniref:SbcC/MukB-like Walker B domain-containing protein n=1 Tax=Labilibacter marinus TaxID=1477105 RepID=UPI00094F4B5C|nr:SMC family ATPase [Labilibacter marinus]
MIPIKLTIEGLYSYQKRQVIDFETLTSNHLFGIFGKVGSGKSSILEAITFALYGKTDRLLIKDDNRNYNMMNLKSNQLFIEFDFKLGKDACEYKVNALAKRNSKNYEDVKKIERTCYRKHHDEYLPITSEELEQAIGLSYDNFKRTIIIPQGKFQEFLQLKSTERTRMMKELFNLHKYELYGNVKNIESKNNALIQNIEGRLEQLGETSVVELETLEKQKNVLKEQLLELNKHLEKNDLSLSEFQKLKENTIRIKSLSQEKQELEQQRELIEKKEKDLSNYEFCQIQFKSNIEKLNTQQTNANKLKSAIDNDSSALEKSQLELSTLSPTFEKVNIKYQQLEEVKKQIDNLNKLVEVIVLTESIDKEQGRLKEGQGIVSKVLQTLEKIEKEEKTINESLIYLKKELPNIELINKAQQWFIEDKSTESLINDLKKEIASTEISKEKLRSDLKQSIQNTATPYDVENMDSIQTELKQKQLKLESSIKELNFDLEHLLINSGLEKYANNLKDEEVCPLCGSTEHPVPFSSESLGDEINQVKKKIANKEKELKEISSSQLALSNYLAAIKPLDLQLFNVQNKLTEATKQQEVHKTKIVEPYKDEIKLAKASNVYKANSGEIAQSEEKILLLRQKLSVENKNKEKYQEALNNIQRNIDKKQNSIDLLRSQISSDFIKNVSNQPKQDIVNKSKELETQVKQTVLEFEKLSKNIESINNSIRTLTAKVETNQSHYKAENDTIAKTKLELESQIEISPFKDLAEINLILKLNINISEAKEIIKAYYNKLQLINNEIDKLSLNIGEQVYDESKHHKLIEQTQSLKDKITQTNQELGKVSLELKTLEKVLLQKKELNEELKKLQLRADDISTLRKMFFKSGFVNYVSSVYLQNLCTTANERFYKMTRQSLSLELSKDNNFEIRDYMNGGKLRNIKTLSGGQTFQAALALALALADNIQSLTESDRNFFFLDEGFGSLDKESLEVVFSTLKTLRNENRIVGVISHVEEMQQEISTYLNIEQDEDSGSKVIESWNR